MSQITVCFYYNYFFSQVTTFLCVYSMCFSYCYLVLSRYCYLLLIDYISFYLYLTKPFNPATNLSIYTLCLIRYSYFDNDANYNFFDNSLTYYFIRYILPINKLFCFINDPYYSYFILYYISSLLCFYIYYQDCLLRKFISYSYQVILYCKFLFCLNSLAFYKAITFIYYFNGIDMFFILSIFFLNKLQFKHISFYRLYTVSN